MISAKLHLVPKAASGGDTATLARVAGGDLAALGDLYERYAQELWSFARRAAPREDAEDVVQTVFERLVRIAASYDGRGESARAWLFGVTARVLQERRRSLRRFAAALMAQGTVGARSAVAEDSGSVDVERALLHLSEAKRVVFLLAEIEGFTSNEIAEMLRIPVGTVWTRLHHARRELRGLFGEEP